MTLKNFTNSAVTIFVAAVLFSSCGNREVLPTRSTSTTGTTSTVGKPPSQLNVEKVGKFTQPIALVERDPLENFVFVAERTGKIQIWNQAKESHEVALDISKLTSTESERGLLGLAFIKDVDDKWWGFINYTNRDGNTVVAAYAMRSDGRFIPSSRRTLFTIDQPYKNHNGGGLVVGADSMLYVATGDGGGSGDPQRNAQDRDSLLGKILRIDPFDDQAKPEIWALGLRNPWRFNFDDDGGLWIADVGQDSWEEVNYSPAESCCLGGKNVNYGWSAFEGYDAFNSDQHAPSHTKPVYVYPHDEGRCSIIGGVTVSAKVLGAFANWYFFSDYCSGEIYGLHKDAGDAYSVATLSQRLGDVVAISQTSKYLFALTLNGDILKLS